MVALQHIVVAFENSFLSVALQEMREGAQVVMPAGMRNTNSMKRNTSRDRLKALSPSSNVYNTIDVVELDRLKRVSSSSSISSLAGGAQFGTIYQKIWVGLSALDSDPFPGVSSLSRVVTDHIRDQVKEATAPREVVEAKASSLPPSPSNRSYLSGNTDASSGISSATDKIMSLSIQLTPKSKKPLPNTINEDIVEEGYTKEKPLVATQFVDWSCNYFAQSIMHAKKNVLDIESNEYYRRDWRYLRNADMRREAKGEVSRVSHSRVENQLFFTKCSSPAQAVAFHPYDPHIAIAVNDNITIWDYIQNDKMLVLRGERPPGGSAIRKICSLTYVNAHDTPLLAAISDDGSVRINSAENGNLVTAWSAAPKQSNMTYTSNSLNRGYIMEWDQMRQEFIIGGNSQFLRVWDAEKELMSADIPTGADSSVSSISLDPTGGLLMCIGCGDGTVRVFDRRLAPHESRVMTFREHTAWVVAATLINDKHIISGSTAGDIRNYDMKDHSSTPSCQIPGQGLKAMAVHTQADIVACGTVNQICMYRRNGIALNVMKYVSHEWFYSPRFGPVGCLAFHPLRVILAAGSADSLVSLYSLDSKR